MKRFQGPARVLAGKDLAGNVYYFSRIEQTKSTTGFERRDFEEEENSAERLSQLEKRWVEFEAENDPASCPVQWQGWLKYRRLEPPTLEELEKFEQDQVELKRKVKELEEEDAKQRLQQFSHGLAEQSSGPDLASFVSQMSGEDVSVQHDTQLHPSKQTSRSRSEPESSYSQWKP